MKIDDLNNKALEALRKTIQEISFIDLVEESREPLSAGGRWDWEIWLRLPDREVRLLVEVNNNGEPRVARHAANQLLRLQISLPGSYGVFVAPWISPSAAQICKEAQVGYLDLAGNCYISFGTVHIERDGNPNRLAEKRDLRSLYSPKASRILRVLLHNPQRLWKLQSLADEAQVSLGQAHKVKSLLADREWLQEEAKGIALRNPAELLAEWARNYSHRKNEARLFYILETVEKAEERLAATCSGSGIRYALAAFSAAARHAPFVRYQRAFAYIQEDRIAEIIQSLSLKEVTSGANLVLWKPYDEGVWYGTKEIAEISVTSNIQSYLDLQSLHERGEEAARFLLEQEIKPRW